MTMIKGNDMSELLPINLQFFASGGEGDTDPNNEVDPAEVDEPKLNTDDAGTKVDEGKFTQEDVDRIVTERLAREKRKRDEEAERLILEEQNNHKELADSYKKEIESLRADALTRDKKEALGNAGYTAEQVELLVKLVEGEEADDINASVEEIKKTVPVEGGSTYVDPSAGNSKRTKPEPVDQYEKGRSLFERVRGKQ